MGLSRLSERCRACPFVETCDHKRMEAVGVLSPQLAEAVSVPSEADLLQPMAVKHDYRDIKIGENTTVTIDLEDLKKKMVDEIYAALGAPGYFMNAT